MKADEAVLETMGITITPGRARIASIDAVMNRFEFMVLEIDMHSKYIEPWLSFNFDKEGAIVLFLGTHDGSLHLDESATNSTCLNFENMTGWQVMCDSGRYTVRFVAWLPEGVQAG